MLTWQHNARRALTTSKCRLHTSAQQDRRHEEEEKKDGEDIAFGDAISALCNRGQLDKATDLMHQYESLLSPATYWSLLKLCYERSSLYHAKNVHAHLTMHHMPPTCSTLYEYLVLTFSKCGDLASALVLFHSLPVRTVFSWTAIVSLYIGSGEGAAALQMYAYMLEECVLPNEYTYVSLLKACGNVSNLQIGKSIHACAWKIGLHSHVVFASSVISMYSKCGAIADAEKAFLATPQHDVVTWTSIIAVLIEHKFVEKAMILYMQMQKQGVAPNEWTISTCLQGCYSLAENKQTIVLEGELGDVAPLEIGRAVHKDATLRGFEGQVFVGNNLLRMYGECGCLYEAEYVFCALSNHDVVLWTAMLSVYVEQGEAKKALKAYRQMVESCTSLDKLALLTILQACCILATRDDSSVNHHHPLRVMAFTIGQALHAETKRKGLVSDPFIGNTLVHLFYKCGKYGEAEILLAELFERDVVAWTVMLQAYIEQGKAKIALQLYQKMQKEGVSPDEHTFAIVLKACCKYADEEADKNGEDIPGTQAALEVGRALHHDFLERGYSHDLCIGSELVTLYGRCGSLEEAEYSFNRLLQPDAIAHSAMLSAYVKEGRRDKALQLYTQLLTQDCNIDSSIYGYMLQSCSSDRSLTPCRQLHHSILWRARSNNYLGLATQLIFAYAGCGSALDAQAMLDSMCVLDVVSWNAFMSGCIQSGDHLRAFEKFEEMRLVGINPNQATFVSLLSACCQTGLKQKGIDLFESMCAVYGVTPRIQHVGCMIDLLGRLGDFDKVEELLSTMQVQPDIAVWLGLLGACQIHGNVELGKYSYEHAVRLQPRQAAIYVLMSNIFANAGIQEQANEVNLAREKASAWKKPGKSWISINDTLRTFVVKESRTFPEVEFALGLQQKYLLWRQEGYIPQIEYLTS
ncbi:hypothetical protein L7F22_023332 [Adiantum nelumboides]|nr:hypothetical protein [Adiantum nelumboides]